MLFCVFRGGCGSLVGDGLHDLSGILEEVPAAPDDDGDPSEGEKRMNEISDHAHAVAAIDTLEMQDNFIELGIETVGS